MMSDENLINKKSSTQSSQNHEYHKLVFDVGIWKVRPDPSSYVSYFNRDFRIDYRIYNPVGYARTYHLVLPILRDDTVHYITYNCKIDIDNSYLCRHSNMEIKSKTLYQSRNWNKQLCKVIVVMNSLQGFFKDTVDKGVNIKKSNNYEPINHEYLSKMFSPSILKMFPSVIFMQVTNSYMNNLKKFSVRESITQVVTHTIIFGYIKTFKIVLSHNPKIIFTIQDCLQHALSNHNDKSYKRDYEIYRCNR